MSDLESTRPPTWASLALAFVVALVFLPGLWNGFVWDDVNVLVISPRLHDWSAFFEVFRRPAMWAANLDTGPVGTYRPLALASFVVDNQLWGDRPFGFHLTSLLLHCAVTVVTFRFLASWSRAGWTAAFCATLLIMVHPTVVEAVVWVNGRSELFVALFGVSAMWMASSPRWRGRREAWLAALMLLAMLGKETGVFFIPLVWACRLIAMSRGDRLEGSSEAPRGAWIWLAVLVAAPFVGYMALRWFALGPVTTPPGGSTLEAMAVLPAVWTRSFQVLLIPLERGIMPMGTWLSHLNGADHVGYALFSLGCLTAIVWSALRRHWRPALGLSWWLLMLLPLPLIVITDWPGFHRWLYVGLPGFALGGIWLAERVRLGRRGWLVWGLVFALLLIQTERSIPVWHNDRQLFSTMAEEWPDAPYSYGAIGIDLLRHRDGPGAEVALRLAIEKGSQRPRLVWLLAQSIALQDRCQEAVEIVLARPDAASVHEPTAQFYLGACFEREGHLDAAQRFYSLCEADSQACAEGLDRLR